MQYITILDYLILPFQLMIVYAIAYRFRNNRYGFKHPYRKYFIPALTAKIIGAIAIGMIYQYYYGGGDTFNFFYHARVINSSFADSPAKWFNLLFRIPNETTLGYYPYISQMYWYEDPASYSVGAVAAFCSFIMGGTYLPAAVIFAVISFTGSWALFRAFAQIYPKFLKPIAIAALFIPTVLLWGSGIFKDTLCFASLGWLTYSVFQILVKRNLKTSNILVLLLSLYVTYSIKLYILMAFIPAVLIWILFIYGRNIKNTALKVSLNLFVLALVGGLSYYVIGALGEEFLGRYSIEKIEETSEITRGWINYASGDEGSAYDLGDMSGPGQMLAKLPLAVNVTLFRPYLWEARKVIVLLTALESFLFLILTLKLLFVVGFRRVWATISQDPTIQFCLIFTVIFAFAVGISSYNFGALSRYKIPCLPFYVLAILLIYYKNSSKPFFKFLNI